MTMDGTNQMIGFAVGGKSFAVPMPAVREIVRVAPLTPVPDAPRHVEGVMNLRGRVLPVVNMHGLLALGSGKPAAGHAERIVVVEAGGRRVGLHVDGNAEVLKLGPQPMSQSTAEVRYEGRVIVVLDVERLLQELEAAA
jgi:purine-binding chemotaxis protein CheW